MTRRSALPGRKHKCRNEFCPNTYSDIIGADSAFGLHKAGAVCIPCLYAEQMISHGQTIDQVEAEPRIKEMFVRLLEKTGWTWQDMKDALVRMRSAGVGTKP